MNRLSQRAAMVLLRPYISRELPGWGKLYSVFVGDYHFDPDWAWAGTRWVRGKLHDYEMLLDLGQWSNRQTYFLGRLYDLPTQIILKRILREGDTFVDIGANEGAISLLGSRLVGPRGKVIAFEPNPKPRNLLQAAINRNKISNIAIEPVGLGDRNDLLRLTAPKINSGEASFGKSNYETKDTETVQCEVRIGDDLLSGIKPALIKIDVEGFELKVLNGLNKTIGDARPPIVMEMVSGHLLNCGTRPTELAAFMLERDYKPFEVGLRRTGMKHDLVLTPITVNDGIDCDVLWTAN